MASSNSKGCVGPTDVVEVLCGKRVVARDLCAGHNRQRSKGQDLRPLRAPRPTAAEGFHWCSTCKQFRPVEDFSWDPTRDQPQRVCKPCRATAQTAYNREHAETIRLRVTLGKWRLTEDQYRDMHEAQEHRCAICGVERRDYRALAIDHDHTTGTLRGLLCQDCNLGLGQFADDPDLLQRALDYLRSGGPLVDSGLAIPPDSPTAVRSRERDAKRARG